MCRSSADLILLGIGVINVPARGMCLPPKERSPGSRGGPRDENPGRDDAGIKT